MLDLCNSVLQLSALTLIIACHKLTTDVTQHQQTATQQAAFVKPAISLTSNTTCH